MKVQIDIYPLTNESQPSAFIRLYPETNREMADLRWIEEVFNPDNFCSSCNEIMMFSVIFRDKPNGGVKCMEAIKKLVKGGS